ncbi:MAG TPA: Maf family protein [Armatimonadota bacterium]|jgi:septum formation protein
MDTSTKQLVLASASPRRRDLLGILGIPFDVVPSDVNEDVSEAAATPGAFVRAAAMLKAEEVARTTRTGVVLGADTIVHVDGEILGKPTSLADAARMLRRLSGRTHQVLTGVAVIEMLGGRPIGRFEDHVETDVRFRKLSPEIIAAYLDTGEPMDKAGAYGIQEKGSLLVDGIVGCFYNVVGLPLSRVAEMLEVVGLKAL